MNKPSEKAIAAASKWASETITLGDLAVEIATKSLALVIDAEIEAQHRKTWALAMERAAQHLQAKREPYRIMWDVAADEVKVLPCPPIEATKDK